MDDFVKSFSVGNGDTFLIRINDNNFSVIDCNIILDGESKISPVLNEIMLSMEGARVKRFISTHPDEDHIRNIKQLIDTCKIDNFYCVDNKIKGKGTDFSDYLHLKESKNKCGIHKSLTRAYLNETKDGIESGRIHFLWPDLNDNDFKSFLKNAENDSSNANQICPIIEFLATDDVSVLWFGDLPTKCLNKIESKLTFPKKNYILFAPHHGRETGKISEELLKKINPLVIVIGEAPSDNLNYYTNYNHICQNSAKSIKFVFKDKRVDVFIEGSGGVEKAGLKKYKIEYNDLLSYAGSYLFDNLKN